MISGGSWLLAATAPNIRIATDVVKTSTCFRISTSIEENTRGAQPSNLTRPVLILRPRNSLIDVAPGRYSAVLRPWFCPYLCSPARRTGDAQGWPASQISLVENRGKTCAENPRFRVNRTHAMPFTRGKLHAAKAEGAKGPRGQDHRCCVAQLTEWIGHCLSNDSTLAREAKSPSARAKINVRSTFAPICSSMILDSHGVMRALGRSNLVWPYLRMLLATKREQYGFTGSSRAE